MRGFTDIDLEWGEGWGLEGSFLHHTLMLKEIDLLSQ